MSKSTQLFERWSAYDETTWSYQIFSQYDDQLGAIGTAHINAMKYTYAKLGSEGAKWEDNVADALQTGDKFLDTLRDLQHWSESYNLFDNSANLARVLTSASNLETYLASIVNLTINSNPGLLFGSPRGIDGAVLLKRQTVPIDTEPHVTACIKGDWSARLAALQRLFGSLPSAVMQHHANLEELRNVRNRFGRAFGRDIDAARDHGACAFHPMEKLTRERAYKLGHVCQIVARELDRYLHLNYVGDCEAIRFFARHHVDTPNRPLGARAKALKTAIGRVGAQPRGKLYCRGLVEYWDAL